MCRNCYVMSWRLALPLLFYLVGFLTLQVVEAATVSFTSVEMDYTGYHGRIQSHVVKTNTYFTSVPDDLLLGSRFRQLYDKSEIQTTDVQVDSSVY